LFWSCCSERDGKQRLYCFYSYVLSPPALFSLFHCFSFFRGYSAGFASRWAALAETRAESSYHFAFLLFRYLGLFGRAGGQGAGPLPPDSRALWRLSSGILAVECSAQEDQSCSLTSFSHQGSDQTRVISVVAVCVLLLLLLLLTIAGLSPLFLFLFL